ncbi:helix-hairpin-helix domain-containing protein [Algoriphagus sp. H41]|uniref:Helix-hairpin-helix domain-containing protein n=1 Tax=Algoriphagus oliviformis TaxID=2811231 RepID=A0ABS3C7P8_9BACT|nr:helix-hairpin-helix domain-containing protein [Algoriphagus oliviformis]MBN7812170.1 helix-hairpin-helix domain-containing protein [Algoriphagus oliviformis]
MKDRFFYWIKSYLGFSGKESRGFLVLIPFLLLFGLLPDAVRWLKNRQAEDILKQYQSRVDSLQSIHIQLVSSPLPTFNPQDTSKAARNQRQLENLNRIFFSQADSVTLQIVPGIGPSTASRIVKYRQRLGGFHSQRQLLEVYGVNEEMMQAIGEFFEFDSVVFARLPINSATVEQLSAHPYISYSEAKVLVAYRQQHGKFSASEDLASIKIFKTEWIERIKPYLDFGQ